MFVKQIGNKWTIFIEDLPRMLPTKFQFIWPSGFRGEDFFKSANQKQELSMAAMFVNGSGQNEQSLERTFHRCFLPSFTAFGWGVSEEKIKMWKVNGRQTPDAKWWQKLTLPLARWAKKTRFTCVMKYLIIIQWLLNVQSNQICSFSEEDISSLSPVNLFPAVVAIFDFHEIFPDNQQSKLVVHVLKLFIKNEKSSDGNWKD